MIQLQRLALLFTVACALLPGLDIDCRLIGYSFLSVERAELARDGLLVTLQDGSQRTIDLEYSYLLGTDGQIERPRILHRHWLRMTHGGRQASLISTSTPLLVLAGGCLLLDGVFLVRLLRRRRRHQENDRDELSPTPAVLENGDSEIPKS